MKAIRSDVKLKLLVAAIGAIEDILRRLKKKLNEGGIDQSKFPQNRAVVFIDHDNITSTLRDDGKVFDYAQFVKDLVEKYSLKFDIIKIFIPRGSYDQIPNKVNHLGYEIVVCQKFDELIGPPVKREDKVDAVISKAINPFLNYDEITHIVILSHDFHSADLISEIIRNGKQMVYFANKAKMKPRLRELVDDLKIPIYPLPSKDSII